MPGRNFSAGNYRYGFNGQEKSDDVTQGNYTAKFWEYDSRLGRRWNVDPKPIVAISSYSTFNNNPLYFSDALGDSSVFDNRGRKIYYDPKDKDLRVFMIGNDKKLSLIGNLGESINVDVILKNKLLDSRSDQVIHGSKLSWFFNVLPGNRWDLKANKNTIFGVAWEHDKTQKSGSHTSFSASYNGLSLQFAHAADVGNFHAGYVGTYAGINFGAQRMFAGGGEKVKNFWGIIIGEPQEIEHFLKNSVLSRPWGDREPDYFWNTMGMSMADYDKKIGSPLTLPIPNLRIPTSDNLRSVLKPIILPINNSR